MTPEQITLVQTSFQELGPQLPAMASRFYQELFARGPALRPLFTIPLALQEVKFAEKLTEIVRAMPRLNELLAHTRALGARHVGYGVRTSDTRPSATLSSPRSPRASATASMPHTRSVGPRLQPGRRNHARRRRRRPAHQ